MKVILYALLSVDGRITQKDGNTDWVPNGDIEDFNSISKKAGAVILGRKSWDEMNPDWLPYKEGDGLYIVLTRNKSLVSQNSKTMFTSVSPAEILKLAQDRGHSEIVVAGGGETYGTFLKSGLIDEIFIDVEPYIFGQGIRFFPESDFELNLKLLETKNLSDQTVQLHYKVKK